MRRKVGRVLCWVGAAASILQLLASSASAVDTMADWVGLNNSPATKTFDAQVDPNNENFVVTSPTSIAGTVQAKIRYNQSPNQDDPPGTPNVNAPHLYLADQALDGPVLSFATPLHMQGTISFDTPSDQAIEPNFSFGWYNSGDTRHRIGLGLSNTVEAPFAPSPDSLRVDLGYAALPANRFYYVTADGTLSQDGSNSRLPDGTYQFTFDYVPGDTPESGGSISATVTDATHSYHYTRAPLENAPWFFDPFALDRFGIVIRSTNATTYQGNFNLTISNVSYTGGTAVPEPSTATLAMLAGLGTFVLRRRRENAVRIN